MLIQYLRTCVAATQYRKQAADHSLTINKLTVSEILLLGMRVLTIIITCQTYAEDSSYKYSILETISEGLLTPLITTVHPGCLCSINISPQSKKLPIGL